MEKVGAMIVALVICFGLVAINTCNPVKPPALPELLSLDQFPPEERAIANFAEWTYTDKLGHETIYSVYTNPPLPYHKAKIFCEANSTVSELATIIYQDQLDFLRGKLKPFVAGIPTKANRAAFWLGGTDLYINSQRGQGQYWIYGRQEINVTFWNEGEPNNYEVGPHRYPETCIDIKVKAHYPDSPFGINDEVCQTHISFICQRPGNY